MTQPAPNNLLRVLGVAFGVAAVVGGTIGQGILRSPGLVAQGVPNGWAIIGLWVAGGLLSAIDAMSTVELATSIRRTGGPYAFARRAFGPFAGLAVGTTDWLANLGSLAFVGVVFGEYLHRLGIATLVPVGLLAATLILATGAIHWFGTRVGGLSQNAGSAVKALIFGALIAALLLTPHGAPVRSAALSPAVTLGGVIVAVRAIYGTYYGWNSAVYFCEEVRDPTRDIVRATFGGLLIVSVVYVMMNVAFLHVLSPAAMGGSPLVAADAAMLVFGPRADTVVTVVSLISLVTIINSVVMMFPRVLFAMARDMQAFPALTRVAANGTPRLALLLTTVGGALLATVGVYDLLLAYGTVLFALVGVAVNVAAIVLRRREPNLDRPYTMPWFPLPALLAMAFNLVILALLVIEDPQTSAMAILLLLAVVAPLYLWLRGRTAVAAATA